MLISEEIHSVALELCSPEGISKQASQSVKNPLNKNF